MIFYQSKAYTQIGIPTNCHIDIEKKNLSQFIWIFNLNLDFGVSSKYRYVGSRALCVWINSQFIS